MAKRITKAERISRLEVWATLNMKIQNLNAERLEARNQVLEVTEHGSKLTDGNGQLYQIVNTTNFTRQHEKVAASLAAKLGMTEDELAAEYEAFATASAHRSIKPL